MVDLHSLVTVDSLSLTVVLAAVANVVSRAMSIRYRLLLRCKCLELRIEPAKSSARQESS